VTSDEEFLNSIAEMVTLVARGDVAAFVIPGQTTVGAQGAQRFAQVYVALGEKARQLGRRAVLRWVFDPIGSPQATQRTESNAVALLAAITAHVDQFRNDVQVEFENAHVVSRQHDFDAAGIVLS
jgi:hypothetical protein